MSITGNVRSFESASVRLDASIAATPVATGFAIESMEGLGAGIFYKYEIVDIKGLRIQITTFGIELPLKICTNNCGSSNPEVIFLEGTIFSELIIGSPTGAATTIGGQLALVTPWSMPFGLSILHIDNVVAGATFDLSKPFPASPSSLILGARVCLGSLDACRDKSPMANDFIDAAAYIGLNAAVPQKNFFFAMISSFTVENVLRVAAVLKPNLNDLINGLPQDVLVSGISPPDANAASCSTNSNNSTALAVGDEELDLNCYAYVAISPLSQNEIEPIGLTIERGISFAGKLNLFNQFVIQAAAHVSVLCSLMPLMLLCLPTCSTGFHFLSTD